MIDRQIIKERRNRNILLVRNYLKNDFISWLLTNCDFYPSSFFTKKWIINADSKNNILQRQWVDYFNNVFVFQFGKKINLLLNKLNDHHLGILYKNIIDSEFYLQPHDIINLLDQKQIYIINYQDYLNIEWQILAIAVKTRLYTWLKINKNWIRIPGISLGLNLLHGIYSLQKNNKTLFNINKIEKDLLIKNLKIEIGK